MNIHFLGIGSVGALTAFHLRRSLLLSQSKSVAKDKIFLQFRNKLEQGRDVSLTIEPPSEGQPETLKGFSQPDFAEGEEATPIDILFVALKADQTLSAFEKITSRLRSSQQSTDEKGGPSTVILLQNGVGQDEALLQRFFSSSPSTSTPSSSKIGRPYILLGSNTHGTWRRSPRHIVHAARGTMHFGLSRAPSAEAVPSAVEQALLSSSTPGNAPQIPGKYSTLQHAFTLLSSPTLRESLKTELESSSSFSIRALRKLVVNCALNPLSALEGCKNGELLEREHCKSKIRDVVKECADVLAARRQTSLEGEEGQLSFPSLLEHVHAVISQTAPNWSSMVQDVRSGRGSTEIDFINGTVVKWGREVGVRTPVNEELVRAIEEKVR